MKEFEGAIPCGFIFVALILQIIWIVLLPCDNQVALVFPVIVKSVHADAVETPSYHE